MPDIWTRLDEQIYEGRWFIVAFLIGLSLIGGGSYFLSDRAQLPFNSGASNTSYMPSPNVTAGEQSIDGPININTASQEELESLPGVGPVIAQRILDYRKAHGVFKKKENLMDVKGIGPKTYADLKDKITIEYLPIPTDYCDFCYPRVREGKKPACVHHCMTQCMEFGPMEEMTKLAGKKKKTVVWGRTF